MSSNSGAGGPRVSGGGGGGDGGGRGGGRSRRNRRGGRGRGKASGGSEASPAPGGPSGGRDGGSHGGDGRSERGGRNRRPRGPRRDQSGGGKAPPPAAAVAAAPVRASASAGVSGDLPAFVTDTPFRSLALERSVIEALESSAGFGFPSMTQIQKEAIPAALAGLPGFGASPHGAGSERVCGSDVLGHAKTGTGKTLAFVVPIANELSRNPPRGNEISALVLTPTRELAAQIEAETTMLAKFVRVGGRPLAAQVVVGGTGKSKEMRRLQHEPCDILVATPGRLLDHLQDTPGIARRMASGALRTLALDECDQMLDMGFKPTLTKIFAFLPSAATRQTLLFSATVAPEVREIAAGQLRKGFTFVDTIDPDEGQTHEHVHQEAVVAEWPLMNATLAKILAHLARRAPKEHKTIVFFPTARTTQHAAELMEELGRRLGEPGWDVVQIHSRRSQAARKKASDKFRESGGGSFLFSSDVSARGMDYPGVTSVVQVGLTTREQYIHRLGRTARAGADGGGILLVSPEEARNLLGHEWLARQKTPSGKAELKDIDIEPATTEKQLLRGASLTLHNGVVRDDMRSMLEDPVVRKLTEVLTDVARGDRKVSTLVRTTNVAYIAWLGFYNSNTRKMGWDKTRLVATANDIWVDARHGPASPPLFGGLTDVPVLDRSTVGKMGLRGTPGLQEHAKGQSGKRPRSDDASARGGGGRPRHF